MANKQTVKVGDRITAKLDDAFKDYRAGDTFYVQEIEEHAGETVVVFTDNVGDTRRRRVSEFTVEHVPAADATGKPAFKVGDRVRLIKDGLSTTGAVGKLATIKSWSGGKVVDNGQYLLNIDGPVDYETLAVQPQYTRASPECFELLAPSLTIETGKFYRTRDGRKVGPIDHNGFGVYGAPEFPGHWYENGLSYSDNTQSLTDLIAEWVDEPASNDNAPATAPAIVALIEGGQPKPSERPKVHKSEQAATDEAERLAVKYPGQKFGVFVLADSRIADVVIRRAA